MGFNLPEPSLNVIKRISVIDGIAEEYAHRASVVCLGYCLESLLACGIPYLQPDLLPINIDCFGLEINAYTK